MYAPPAAQRQIILGDLVVLRHVGIKIALAIELAEIRDLTAAHQPCHHRLHHRFAVGIRQHARESHADRTYHRIRLLPELVRTRTEHLAVRPCLDMHFKTYDYIVF